MVSINKRAVVHRVPTGLLGHAPPEYHYRSSDRSNHEQNFDDILATEPAGQIGHSLLSPTP